MLTAIGAIDEGNGTPMIEALNKIDELPLEQRRILQARTSVGPERSRQFPVSALSGEGVDTLLQAIEDRLGGSEAREVTGAAQRRRHHRLALSSRRRAQPGGRRRGGPVTVALDAAATAQFERRLAR